MVDRSAAHVARVNMAAATGYGENLLQAIDSMLASRFHRQLPMGGRVAQVRAIARADEKDLPPAVAEMRNKPGNPISEVRKAVAIAGKPTLAGMTTAEAKACVAALSRIHLPQVTLPTLREKSSCCKATRQNWSTDFHLCWQTRLRNAVSQKQNCDVDHQRKQSYSI